MTSSSLNSDQWKKRRRSHKGEGGRGVYRLCRRRGSPTEARRRGRRECQTYGLRHHSCSLDHVYLCTQVVCWNISVCDIKNIAKELGEYFTNGEIQSDDEAWLLNCHFSIQHFGCNLVVVFLRCVYYGCHLDSKIEIE